MQTHTPPTHHGPIPPAPRLGTSLALLLAALGLHLFFTIPAPAAPPKVRQIPIPEKPEPFEPASPPDTPAGRRLAWLIEVINGKPLGEPADAFTPDFLKTANPKAIAASLKDLTKDQARDETNKLLLHHVNAGASPSALVAIIATADSAFAVRIELGVDPESEKIDLIDIQPLGGSSGGDPSNQLGLDKLKGKVSLLAIEFPPEDDQDLPPLVVLEYKPDQVLAIATSFKLWVLGSLGEAVRDGRASWDEPLAISSKHRSLPGGLLHLAPEGKTYPLRTFAESMIALDDNTAADHLIARLGRDRIEEFMSRTHHDGSLNQPLLTTREFFTLKLPPDIALRQRYLVADEPRRRKLLAPSGAITQAAPSPLLQYFWTKPVNIGDIEWFAGVRDLCRVLAELHTLEQTPGLEPLGDALRQNHGVPLDPEVWTSAGFKGGSEPGVLSLSWLLERADGRHFALAMIWNSEFEPVNEDLFREKALEALNQLAKMP
jgi:beta-lactamase class A